MLINTAFADVELTANEPFGIGSLPLEGFRPLLPAEFFGLLGPKFSRAVDGLAIHAPILRHALDSCLFRKLFVGLKTPFFAQMALDVVAHVVVTGKLSKPVSGTTIPESKDYFLRAALAERARSASRSFFSKGRHFPGGRLSKLRSPMRTRIKRLTRCPTAWIM